MNAMAMIAACRMRQGGSEAYPDLGRIPSEPDPVNHETLTGVADHGVDGHGRLTVGADDARVPAEGA